MQKQVVPLSLLLYIIGVLKYIVLFFCKSAWIIVRKVGPSLFSYIVGGIYWALAWFVRLKKYSLVAWKCAN